MRVYRGLPPAAVRQRGCALTIGNFDGVHRGHQAVLALLVEQARARGLPACVLTFEPHPRDYFARLAGRPETAPRRISTLRDAVAALAECGIDQLVVLRFDAGLAALEPEAFIDRIVADGLGARGLLVGDDFRFGARRRGDFALLRALAPAHGIDVARMASHQQGGLRVSSSAVRLALAEGDLLHAQELLGRPWSVSARAIHGRKLGRELGFRTLNLRFGHPRPAAMGIFVARVLGLGDAALPAVVSLGVRPTVEDAGRVLLEAHCLEWPPGLGPEAGYGRCLQVQMLHKLHDERRYESIEALRAGIAQDVADARAWFAQVRR